MLRCCRSRLGHTVLILTGLLLHIGCGARRIANSQNTLLVRVFGTSTTCVQDFNFDAVLSDLTEIADKKTNGMTVALSYDCSSYYYKIGSISNKDFVFVQFLTTEPGLTQNTTDVFTAMSGTIDEHLNQKYPTMFEVSFNSAFFITD